MTTIIILSIYSRACTGTFILPVYIYTTLKQACKVVNDSIKSLHKQNVIQYSNSRSSLVAIINKLNTSEL